MKTLKKLLIISLFILILLNSQITLANNSAEILESAEYSEEYLDWLTLSTSQQESSLEPRMYTIPDSQSEINNPIYLANMLGTSFSPTYSLHSVISNNLAIKNQLQTNTCWAFASLASLETNLALRNSQKGLTASIPYDFSERHMEYATSNVFLDKADNPLGYNRKVGSGGNWAWVTSYLTNGSGAINESSMPFENNEDIIDISEIQNKTITSQVYDTVEFSSNVKDDISIIKEHIQNYGAVFAGVHFPSINSNAVYNSSTGALYVPSSSFYPSSHAVSIIGWDDNYSVDNFNAINKPKSNGAWIAKNSYGTEVQFSLDELRNEVFVLCKTDCISNGWTDATLIPNTYLEKLGYTIDGNTATMEIGDNGLIYISYEDYYVYNNLNGIIKASDVVNYENIYQYDEFFPAQLISFGISDTKYIMLCNVFEKSTNGPEYLTQVSIYAPQTYTCRVYVNPTSDSKSKSDLHLVTLQSGESETFDAGYHTLEFLEPIEITGDKFVVLVEIECAETPSFSLESLHPTASAFNNVTVETEKCFWTAGNNLETCTWYDLGKISESNSDLANGDSTIKAFTISEVIDDSLKNIEITNPPTKTEYFQGENFNSKGLIVKANFNNGTSYIIDNSSYNIKNGTNLKEGQSSITITYQDQSIEQPISVERNSVTNISIKNSPTKTQYIEGENFDKTGMVIEATRKDGSTEIVTDYTIENGNNLKVNQTTITICYEEKTVEQTISVLENSLVQLKVSKVPNRTDYVVGQNFDKTGMIVIGIFQDKSSLEITDYTIEDGTHLVKYQSFVTISYDGKTTTQPITVEEKTITSIKINQKPSKLAYTQNKDSLDLTGGSITVTYNDGTTQNILMNSDEVSVSDFSNKNVGKITVTVSYQSYTAKFNVEIIEEPVEETIEEQAQNSNFDNSTCNVTRVRGYYFSANSYKNYVLIDIDIENINRNSENDKVEYYYHVSPIKNEKNITDWTKITESQNSSDKITFTLNSKEISNYDDLSNEKVLYLYIKEVAVKGGNQSVIISEPFELTSTVDIETYLNNAETDLSNKESATDTENSTSSSNKNESSKTQGSNTKPTVDTTVANTILPATGLKLIASIVFIIFILFFSLIHYIKYTKYKDIK